jgi:hypothetical protein
MESIVDRKWTKSNSCSLSEDSWMNLVLGYNILLENSRHTLQRRPDLQKPQHKVPQNSSDWKLWTVLIGEHTMHKVTLQILYSYITQLPGLIHVVNWNYFARETFLEFLEKIFSVRDDLLKYHFDSSRWDHYTVSKCQELITQWHCVISQKNINFLICCY